MEFVKAGMNGKSNSFAAKHTKVWRRRLMVVVVVVVVVGVVFSNNGRSCGSVQPGIFRSYLSIAQARKVSISIIIVQVVCRY